MTKAIDSPDTERSRNPRQDAAGRSEREWHIIGEDPLSKRRVSAYRLGIVVALVALWQAAVTLGGVDTFWVSSPGLVAEAFVDSIVDGSLPAAVASSVYLAVLAFLIAGLAGIVCGFLLAASPMSDAVLAPFIVAANSMPRIAIAPLVILWFGIGDASKIVVAMTLVFFILLVNAAAGAKDVDADLMAIAKAMGANRRQLLTKVVLPSAVPWIFAGLNLGLTYSLLGVVVAEILSSNEGIGFIISYSAATFDTTGVFVALLALAIVAYIFNSSMRYLENRLLKWRPATPGGT